jgi:modification methylase
MWQRDVLSLAWATLTDDGAIFFQHKPIAKGNETRLPLELIPEGVPLRQIVVWDRGSGFQRTHWHYVPRQEWVMILAKPAFRLSTLNVDDVWPITPETGTEHPTPFPLKLASRAIATTHAQVVLDPFMGSGTTLRAAKDLGRKAIGIELSERYCEIAAKRLAQEVLPL